MIFNFCFELHLDNMLEETIKFKIVNIDKDAKRISLSYKETLDNPWTKVMDSIGQKVKIKISHLL